MCKCEYTEILHIYRICICAYVRVKNTFTIYDMQTFKANQQGCHLSAVPGTRGDKGDFVGKFLLHVEEAKPEVGWIRLD